MTEIISTLAARRERRLRGAFVAEEHESQDRAAWVRLAALAVIAAWLLFEQDFPANLYYEALLLIFIVLGFAPVWLRRAGLDTPWQRYVFPLLDAGLLSYTLLVANPYCDQCQFMPAPLLLRFDDALFFILIGGAVFSYSPRIVMWTGAAAVIAWTAGTLWIAGEPEIYMSGEPAGFAEMADAAKIAFVIDPNRIDIGALVKVDLVLLIVAGVLAAAVHRTRKLAYRHAQLERDRANLARHFSPNMVDEIAHRDQPMGAVRREDVTVLFVDIVGFTHTSENEDPEPTPARTKTPSG